MPTFASNMESISTANVGFKIFIMAYGRVRSLERLLESLKTLQDLSDSGHAIDLVISLDKGYEQGVYKVVHDMDWTFGDKTIVVQGSHLGLNAHVFELFRMASENVKRQFVLFLEDDTMALDGLDKLIKYQSEWLDDEDLFSASFYNYYRNEELGIPFIPIQTGLPVYAMQKVSSRGWMSTSDRIADFLSWKEDFDRDFSMLPKYMQKWEKKAWEKWVNTYLVMRGKYSLFPYYPATTGFGEVGDHYRSEVHRFLAQTPFHPLAKMQYDNGANKEDLVRYDVFYEIDPAFLVEKTRSAIKWNGPFDADLYGTKSKDQLRHHHVLTSRFREDTDYTLAFGMDLLPVEQNILMRNPGNELRLIASQELPKQSLRQHYMQRYRFRLQSHTYQTIKDGLLMKLARIFRL